MRSKFGCGLLILLFTVVSLAQDKPGAEVTGAYQFTRLYGVNIPLGWDASANVPVNNWFGVVGDFGGATKSESGVRATILMYGGGPQFTLRTPLVAPYFRIMLGAAHVGASGYGVSSGTTAFLVAPAGGADFRVADHLWFRMGASYPFGRKNGVTLDGIQAVVGVTYRFGGRHESAGPTPADVTRSDKDSGATGAAIKIDALGAVVTTGRNEGVVIVTVAPNGLAALAGLHPGDVIHTVDGRQVKNPTELAAELSGRPSGDKVRLGFSIHGAWNTETVIVLGDHH